MNKLIIVDGIQAVGKTTFCKSLNKPVIHGLSYLGYNISTYLNFSREKRLYDGFYSIYKAVIENINKNVVIDRSILSSLYFARNYKIKLEIPNELINNLKLNFSNKPMLIYYLYAKPKTILERRLKRFTEIKNLPLNREIKYKLDICKNSSLYSIEQELDNFNEIIQYSTEKFNFIKIKKINLE